MNVVESSWKPSPADVPAPPHPRRAGGSAEEKLRPEPDAAHPGQQPRLSGGAAGAAVPAYRVHRAKQLGYVRLNKRMVYLGKANTLESFEHYRRVLGEWLACGRVPARGKWDATPSLTVDGLVDAFLLWARRYYRDADGNPSPGLAPVEAAAKKLRALYGPTPAAEFGPVALKAVRHAMIQDGLCRNVINQRAGCIKRMFRWAVGEELLPPTVLQALPFVLTKLKHSSWPGRRRPVKVCSMTSGSWSAPTEPSPLKAMR